MPEPVTPAPANNNNPTPPGNDPKPPGNGGQNNQQPNQNQNNPVQDDKMIPKHRFDEVNTKLTELEKWKADQEAAQRTKEEEDLKKKGEFETLANKNKAEADQAKAELQTERVNNAIAREAAKQGIQDLDAATKLIDRSLVKVDKDGQITGIEEAVNGLVTSRPYLKNGVPQPNLGGGTNPPNGGNNQTPRFKHSQLMDPVFYRANEKEITEALKLGLVEDDLAPAR